MDCHSASPQNHKKTICDTDLHGGDRAPVGANFVLSDVLALLHWPRYLDENLDKAINKKNSDVKIALATIYNTVHAFKKAGHLKEILIKDGKNYFDTNTSSHHHFYDETNNELTDIENNKIELRKFPTPPKGKSICNVNVIINIDNDNQNH